MKKWRIIAILFTLLCFGAIRESLRIYGSSDFDIESSRKSLLSMSLGITGILVILTAIFWYKSFKRISNIKENE